MIKMLVKMRKWKIVDHEDWMSVNQRLRQLRPNDHVTIRTYES